MSVFKKVVGRVRGFFLEPETKAPPPPPPPKPAVPQSTSPARPSRPPADKAPDAFEWEPPPKSRTNVEEIPRPQASPDPDETLGFASVLREAARHVEEREAPETEV